MNTYEEKIQAKRKRFSELADKARMESDSSYTSAKSISSFIPFGQPILVGHHSEGRHRRDIKKMDNNMRKSIELTNKAEYYEDKAINYGTNSISSDDPEALTKLKTKLESLEQSQTLMKTANKIIRKKGATAENTSEDLLKLSPIFNNDKLQELFFPTWGNTGFKGFHLTNNNATMKTIKNRISTLESNQKLVTKEWVKDGFILKQNIEENRMQFIFEGKPSEEIRKVLKSNGFKWSPRNLAWQRQLTSNATFALKHHVLPELEKLNK